MTRLVDAANDVLDELGLARPSGIIDSSDPNARKVAAAAQRAGQMLWRAHDWSVMHREYEFTTTASVDNYQVPEDWGRTVSNTAWDRTQYWSMRGNLTPSQWQVRRSGLVATAATRFGFRALIGDRQASILLDPVPAGEYDLVIEYISRYWVENTSQEPFERFESDFHHIRLDGELFTMGLRWNVRKAFGFPYADDRADYEVAVRAAIKNDLRMPMVNVAPDYVLPYPNMPEGSWPEPSA